MQWWLTSLTEQIKSSPPGPYVHWKCNIYVLSGSQKMQSIKRLIFVQWLKWFLRKEVKRHHKIILQVWEQRANCIWPLCPFLSFLYSKFPLENNSESLSEAREWTGVPTRRWTIMPPVHRRCPVSISFSLRQSLLLGTPHILPDLLLFTAQPQPKRVMDVVAWVAIFQQPRMSQDRSHTSVHAARRVRVFPLCPHVVVSKAILTPLSETASPGDPRHTWFSEPGCIAAAKTSESPQVSFRNQIHCSGVTQGRSLWLSPSLVTAIIPSLTATESELPSTNTHFTLSLK